MTKIINSIAILVLLAGLNLLMINSCISSKQDSKDNQSGEKTKTTREDFDDFYFRFHTDSLFQISRVIFPLKGFQSDNTTEESEDFDVPNEGINDWIMMHLPVLDSDLILETEKTDTLVKERIYIDAAGFETGRTFIRINNIWYLDYFYTRM